jgi:tRNA A-37 threonylcarbamoyl transferase component Bud32
MPHEIKDTARAKVRIGFDGRVFKSFRGPKAEERFANEVRILEYLERRGCNFVPRVLETNPAELLLVTSSCGARVEHMSEERVKQIFAEVEEYGVRHDDPFLRNITYRNTDGRFCVIDFEFATILDEEPKTENIPPKESAG